VRTINLLLTLDRCSSVGHLDAECISARITGAAPGGQANGPCASIGVRDTTAGRRTGAPPP